VILCDFDRERDNLKISHPRDLLGRSDRELLVLDRQQKCELPEPLFQQFPDCIAEVEFCKENRYNRKFAADRRTDKRRKGCPLNSE
jgi:hypothetical protein